MVDIAASGAASEGFVLVRADKASIHSQWVEECRRPTLLLSRSGSPWKLPMSIDILFTLYNCTVMYCSYFNSHISGSNWRGA